MKKENKKNIIKKLILVLAILVIILIIVLNLTKSKSENDKVEHLGSVKVDITEQSTEIENFDVIVDNLPIKSITMRNRIQNFCINRIKTIYSNIVNSSEKEIEEYYNQNKATIDAYIYKSDLSKFKKLATELQKINEKELFYSNNKFDVSSFNNNDAKNRYFDMKVQYNNKYEINFTVHIEREVGEILESNIFFEVK